MIYLRTEYAPYLMIQPLLCDLVTVCCLVEIVVEKDTTERPGPLVDLHMMTVCCEGRQRSMADFRLLLEHSDFRLQRVIPTAAPISIVEAFAVEPK